MSSPTEIIKEKLSIVDVISSYIQVEQSGKNFKAKCPFHNEKTPSFFISPDRGTYYCFGCGAKGDIFSFVEQFEGLDFMGSLKLLAERAGVVLSSFSNNKIRDNKEIYYEIMEEATSFFEREFSNNNEARAYLLSRSISDQSIKSFRIGYARNEWRSVSDYLLKKGYKREDIEKVGLIKTKDGNSKEDKWYDRFRGRIMFPLCDSSGRVIAFSGRIFGKEDSSSDAKYLNSPDTPLFNKSNVLFGIDKAKTSIRTRGYSIIVEGQMDLILSHQAGFTNTVAVSGTAFTDSINDDESRINNLGLIRRLSSNIIFAFDGDNAGIRAVSRSSIIALSLDMQVKIAILRDGKDPADIIKENPDEWKEVIKNSVNIVSFHLDRICKSTNDLRLRGKQVREIIFPFIAVIKSSIEKSAYISLIHKETGLPEKAILEDFELYENSHKGKEKIIIENKNNEDKIEKKSRRDNLERRLFGIIFWQKDNGDFSENIKELLENFKSRIGEIEFNKILAIHEIYSDVLALEIESWYGGKTNNIMKDVEEIILSLEEEILNEKLIILLDEINKKEKIGEKEELGQILKDYQKITERIENIKKNRLK